MSALLNHERQNRGKPRAGRTSRPAQQRQPVLSPDHTRTLLRVAFRTPGVLVAIIATVVLVTLVSVNSELTGTFGAIAGLWFAVHQVPLSISGTALGVFPLVPTLMLGLVVARGISRTVSDEPTRKECAWIFGAAVIGPIVVTALALAVAADASAAIGLSSPNALIAFLWVAIVHGTSAAVGLLLGSWHAVEDRLPEWVRAAVVPTVGSGAVLVAGAASIVAAAMVASWSTVGMLLESGNGFVGVLGLTVLSVLYLPNVVVGALAVSVGSSAHVGDVTVSMFGTTGGPVPPLPVLGILPDGASHTIWTLMFVVPVAAAVVLGRACARRTVDIHNALSAVWSGAAVLGLSALVIGLVSGGSLGTFGTVEVTVWTLGLLVFAWTAVVGSLAAAVTVWRGDSKPVPEPEPAPASTAPVAAIAAPVEPEAIAAEPAEPAEPVVHEERAVEAEVVEEPEEIVESPSEEASDTEQPLEAEVVETDEEPGETSPDKRAESND